MSMKRGLLPGKKPVALVMQGGGALGAYEWGAVTCLCNQGFYPVAVAGVSIGAVNAAVIAGARRGDVAESLKELWGRLMIDTWPLHPLAAPWASMFGVKAMYSLKTGFFPWVTEFCDVTPLRRTLEDLCNFEQINNPSHMGFAVTATDVQTGVLKRFTNTESPWRRREKITPDHVLASGALPPGFPMARVNGKAYWDGGLFDNTPVRPMIDLLDDEEADSLPIIQINLFPDGEPRPLPTNIFEVQARKMELTFENRFWDDYAGKDGDGVKGLREYADMIAELRTAVDQNVNLRQDKRFEKLHQDEQFQRLLKRRCLRNLHVVPSGHNGMDGGIDFSADGICKRYRQGYESMKRYFDSPAGKRLRESRGSVIRTYKPGPGDGPAALSVAAQ
jgi:NTE family protein